MITLYGVYRSRASRPLWLLGELDQPFTHVPVIQAYRVTDLAATDAPCNTANRDFLAINPQGQIPAIVDGDLVLTESLAICQHIARSAGGPLGPQTTAETALTDQWAMFGATAIDGPALDILYTIGNGLADTPQGAAKIADSAAKLARPMARLERVLATSDWLIGNRFTVADLMVAECLRYAQGYAPLMDAHPCVTEWLTRCQSRPAFKAMWERRLAEPA